MIVALLAFLVLAGWTGIVGHIIREWRKGHRAALIYGPLVMLMLVAAAGWCDYALMYRID